MFAHYPRSTLAAVTLIFELHIKNEVSTTWLSKIRAGTAHTHTHTLTHTHTHTHTHTKRERDATKT